MTTRHSSSLAAGLLLSLTALALVRLAPAQADGDKPDPVPKPSPGTSVPTGLDTASKRQMPKRETSHPATEKVAPRSVAVELAVSLGDVKNKVLKSLVKPKEKDGKPVQNDGKSVAPSLPLVLAGDGKDDNPPSVTLPVPMLTRHTVIERVVKIVVEQVTERVERRVKVLESIFTFPPRPPHEVIKVIWEDVKKEVRREVVENIPKQVQKVCDATQVRFTFRVELHSLDLSMAANVLTCEAGVGIVVVGKPVEQGILPDGPTTFTLPAKLTTRKELGWDNEGKLTFAGGESKVWIKPISEWSLFPGMNPANVLKLNLLAEVFKDQIDRVVGDELRKIELDSLKTLVGKVEETGKLVIPGFKKTIPYVGLVEVPETPLTVSEVRAHPIHGDDKSIRVCLTLDLVNKVADKQDLKIVPMTSAAPKPDLVGDLVTNDQGELSEVKWNNDKSWRPK